MSSADLIIIYSAADDNIHVINVGLDKVFGMNILNSFYDVFINHMLHLRCSEQ